MRFTCPGMIGLMIFTMTACHDNPSSTEQNCFYGDYVIQQSDDVRVFHPYTCITGTLSIVDSELESVELPNLMAIGGSLIIEDAPLLTDLAGLENLVSVGQDIGLRGNDALVDLEGLNSLITIGGSIMVLENDSLRNLGGFSEYVSTIPGSIIISDNPVLETLHGLQGIRTVGGDVIIFSNETLNTLEGLESLTFVEGSLLLEENPGLLDCTGLSGLAKVSGDLEIVRNDGLISFDCIGDLSIVNTLTIEGNASLTDLSGLRIWIIDQGITIKDNPSLSTFEGWAVDDTRNVSDMVIDNNDALVSMNGFPVEIDAFSIEYLVITDNNALQDVDGLEAVKHIGITLSIRNNPALSHLDGLRALRSVEGGVEIVENGTLPDCDICVLLNQLLVLPLGQEVHGNLQDECYSSLDPQLDIQCE